MENTKKLQITCVVLLFLILIQQVNVVEGRKLRSRSCKECSKKTMNVVVARKTHDDRSSRRVFEVDDFRPTAPGHSPGVGHSINN